MSREVVSAVIRGARAFVQEAESAFAKAVGEKGEKQSIEFPGTAFQLPMIAALTGIDSYAHPIKLFERPAADWPQRRIDELLPEHHVAAVQPAETVVAEPQPVG